MFREDAAPNARKGCHSAEISRYSQPHANASPQIRLFLPSAQTLIVSAKSASTLQAFSAQSPCFVQLHLKVLAFMGFCKAAGFARLASIDILACAVWLAVGGPP
jgi:hypothetical protein